jgi:hypothetical protein
MDPERLAKLREFIDPESIEAELLADRDRLVDELRAERHRLMHMSALDVARALVGLISGFPHRASDRHVRALVELALAEREGS